ncbi:MAG: GTPase ObgE [Desulfobacteraceae bacterium]|nr:GTPase ObgE [Desulfobacteraceae bacterium]
MKFIDEAKIIVQSGNGGSGCVSFRRERFVPRGGPDGGDGGNGGYVFLKATSRKRTLHHFQFKKHYSAKNGVPGQGSQKTGQAGSDLILEVPQGTLVYNAETGELLFDLVDDDQAEVVVQGGRGGLGNRHFKSSTNRSPRYAQSGEPGQTLQIRLELKLLADVGLVGLPNAGKSTLISTLSSAKPKIADYPFTTLTPNLGVVQYQNAEPFVVADIPGLIEGAHQGAGLGTRFLRHIERTRILVHLIDAAELDPANPLASYEAVKRELVMHSRELADKPQLVVLNKLDIDGTEALADAFCKAAPSIGAVRISAAARQGLNELKARLLRHIEHLDD